MIPEPLDRLGPFRDKAVARGVPVEDVERWVATARPCATLTFNGNGPVVGRLGGPLLLPADVPDPVHPFVASIDLAALAGVTDLPLPPDGHLLLFAYPEEECCPACSTGNVGGVVHVPAGAAVVERDADSWSGHDVDDRRTTVEEFPRAPLKATADVSLPYHYLGEDPGTGRLPGHPRSEELVEVWDDVCRDVDLWCELQIGGYSNQEAVGTDPVADAVAKALRAAEAGRLDWPVSADVRDWALLADWHLDVSGWEGATVHWSIQRDDLAARRFDRAVTTLYWNP
ncbi:DUF1963 domain-containing protein [Umezawaea tangerina]|uniref:Uncharacterized protein DUF1963 n=1 Tax=Umezawaea tangerina TaxID=84725 RepID=A0A2T0STY0_9PSEU|nr:DUF1963 domain-containing protein [Umezawaea tangerina]PRY36813.1 uncharacterized protein DUF1963 [Umezawaea tangerina]